MNQKQRMIMKLDEYASLVARKRDNCCVMCGAYHNHPEMLQAHHWIIRRGMSLKYRFDIRNLVSLCPSCHLEKVHGIGSDEILSLLKERALLSNVCTSKEFEEIKSDGCFVYPMRIDEMKNILEDLRKKAK